MIELINMFVDVGIISYNKNDYNFYITDTYYDGYVYLNILECYYSPNLFSIEELYNNEEYKNLIL